MLIDIEFINSISFVEHFQAILPTHKNSLLTTLPAHKMNWFINHSNWMQNFLIATCMSGDKD